MKPRRTLFVPRLARASLLLAGLLLVGAPGPAAAIVGGDLDGTGHPGVAEVDALDADGHLLATCTGVLIAPAVVLTAAHCVDAQFNADIPVETYVVSFDPAVSVVDDGVGFVIVSPTIEGQPVSNPAFTAALATEKKASAGLLSLDAFALDYGVLLLDQNAATVFPSATPQALPPLSSLDPYGAGTRNRYFTAVGYGDFREGGPRGRNTVLPIDDQRRFAIVPLKRLTNDHLYLLGNDRDARGTGGTCFGDSGGPVFAASRLVALNNFGQTYWCLNGSGGIRLDSPRVQAWLAQFLS